MLHDHAIFPAIINGKLTFLYPDQLEFMLFRKQGNPAPISGIIPLPDNTYILAYDPDSLSCRWTAAESLTKVNRIGVVVNTKRKAQVVTTNDGHGLIGVPCGSQSPAECYPLEDEHGILVPAISLLKNIEAPFEIAEMPASEFKSGGAQAKYPLVTDIPLNHATGYVLGLICGDGWAVQGKGQFYGVAVAKVRDDVMDQFDSRLRAFFAGATPPRKQVETKKGNHGQSIKNLYDNVELGRLVHKYCGHGAKNKHLPDFFMCTPLDFRLGLFAGLMDSDGSISISNGKKKPQLMASYTSISLRMIREVHWLAMSLGTPGTITPTKTPKGEESYILNFSTIAIQQWDGRFMANQDRLKNLKSVPNIIKNDLDIVPISTSLAKAFSKKVGCPKITTAMKLDPSIDRSFIKQAQSVYATLNQAANPNHAKHGTISRASAKKLLSHPKLEQFEHPDLETFIRITCEVGVNWQRVQETYELGHEDSFYKVYGDAIQHIVTMDGLVATAGHQD